MERVYVAVFSTNEKKTHAIRGEWSYSRIAEARTVCGRSGPFATEHRASGQPIKVTCAQCARADND